MRSYLCYFLICFYLLGVGFALLPLTADADTMNPASCQEVKDGNQSAVDGNYWLTVNGKMFEVYCAGMDTAPKEYISLVHTGEYDNYSFYKAGGPSYSDGGSEGVKTHFTKIRFNPSTFMVDTSDFIYSESTGNTYHGGMKLNQYPYAQAGGCNWSAAQGTANIDLRGTPFSVATGSLVIWGWGAGGDISYSYGNQVVNMIGWGYCGFALPAAAVPLENELFGGEYLQLEILPDTIAPVITLNKSGMVRVNAGDSYNDAGVTANDNLDRNLTANIIKAGTFVDTSVPGMYTITYNLKDAENNAAAEVTRTVVVAPVKVTTTAGVGKIIVSGAQPGAALKLYNTVTSVKYGGINADKSGNAVFPALTPGQTFKATQTVNGVESDLTDAAMVLADTSMPVITLNESSMVRVKAGDSYNDAGATANDDQDGDITAHIIKAGTFVDTSLPGTYTITYKVKDAENNAATEVTRKVVVAPVKVTTTAGVGKIIVSGAQPGAALKLYNTVTSVEYGGINADESGNAVFLALTPGQTFTATQTVNGVESDPSDTAMVLADTSIPVITLNESSMVRVNIGDSYIDAGATASDDPDRDLTANIIKAGTFVDTSVPGMYTITYNVKDAENNAATEVTRTVVVAPVKVTTTAGVGKIIVSGAQPGTALKLYNTVTSVEYGGINADESGNAVFPALTPGQTFTATQTVNGVESDPSDVTTTFGDTTSPTIELVGSSIVRVVIGDSYTDSGARAFDDQDGEITSSITQSGTFSNTAVIGTYSIIYNARDKAGNATMPLARTVQVVPDKVTAIPGIGSVTVVGAEPAASLKLYDSVTSAVYAGLTANSSGGAQFNELMPGRSFSVTQTVYGLESDPTTPVIVLANTTQLQPMLLSAETDSQGTHILLTYNRPVSSSVDMSKYLVTIGGTDVAVTNAVYDSLSPQTIILTLSHAASYNVPILLVADIGAVNGLEGFLSQTSSISVTNRTAPPITEQVREQLRQSDLEGDGIDIGDILRWILNHSERDLTGDGKFDVQDIITVLQNIDPVYVQTSTSQ